MGMTGTAISLPLRCDTVLVGYEEVVQALNDFPSPRAFWSSMYRGTTSRRYRGMDGCNFKSHDNSCFLNVGL
jgi:hypothetical protein